MKKTFIYSVNHFNQFALMVLDYDWKVYFDYKQEFSADEWTKMRSRVIKDCDQIIRYSLSKDDRNKAKLIRRTAESENVAKLMNLLPDSKQGGDFNIKNYEFEDYDYRFFPPKTIKIAEARKQEQSAKGQSPITLSQIALKYVYEGLQITRKNGDEIAKQYGYKSGEKLFQKFSFFSSTANRKGSPNPCTTVKLTNKIKLLESVKELVTSDKIKRIEDEVSILKSIQESEYL